VARGDLLVLRLWFGLAWLGLVWFGFPDQANKQVPQQHRMQSRHEIHMPKAAVKKIFLINT